MNKYDVVVIGAGPGGYPCAIRLGQLKKKVLVIEDKELGGLCLNWGCIPTKALSFAAETLDNIEKAKRIGFDVELRGFDLDLLRNWKDGVVKRLRNGIEYLFKNNGVEWQKGRARIISEHEVTIENPDGTKTCEVEKIVIATGTEVVPLPGLNFDGKYIINTDDALALNEIPKRLLIVGAGASGLEMATIYKRLGSKVVVVEIMDQVLPGMEKELCEGLFKILSKSGIEILLNATVISCEPSENLLFVAIKKGSTATKETFDKVLVTVGRKPFDYAFKDVNIETDKKGYVLVDDNLCTNIKNIYAIGDLIGPPLLAHKATKQGILCAEYIGGRAEAAKRQSIPSCVFTIPPLASIGLSEVEAQAQGYKVNVGRFPYRASGRALSMDETDGLVKIVGDEKGKLLGLHILGAEAPNLIGEGILAVAKEMSVADLVDVIHPHPTLTEIIGEAAENFYKKAIHIVN